MNIDELNSWVVTDEGAAWLENQKLPLVNKKNELLSALKAGNAKIAELDQRSSAAEKALDEERSILSTFLVDKQLTELLKSANVFETVIPGTVAELKERYAIRVKADGPNRTAQGLIQGEDGAAREVNLAAIVSEWSRSPEARSVILETNNGGGAPGSGVYRKTPPAAALAHLSGPALAKMSDAEFYNLRNTALSAKG